MENMVCECEGPGSDAEDVKEDERNAAPYGTAHHLQFGVRAYNLGRKRKEANDAKLGKGKCNGRSCGRAASQKGKNKGEDKKQGKEPEGKTAAVAAKNSRYRFVPDIADDEVDDDAEAGLANSGKGGDKGKGAHLPPPFSCRRGIPPSPTAGAATARDGTRERGGWRG